jgi:glycosyltransferase involved in cell wall biosynthesis
LSPNEQTLRVLQVSAFYPAHGGGIEVVAGRLAEGLASEGVQLTWMAGCSSEEVPQGGSGLRVEPASAVDFCERFLGLPLPLWGLASLRKLWKAVRSAQLVQVHDYLYFPSLITLLFAWCLRRPVVVTQHIGWIEFNSSVARFILRTLNRSLGRFVLARVARVIFVSRPVADYWAAILRRDQPGDVIANGVDHQRYAPAAPGLRDGALKLLFVGRFVEKKGIHLLRSCLDIPGVHWTFVGWGPLSPRQWDLAEQVTVLEGLRAEEVVHFYQQADLLVLPSKGEGFPLVIQESLACGTPVFVSEEVRSAFPSLDERCVFAADVSGADAAIQLRQALSKVASEPDLLRKARPHAEQLSRQWSWESCVEAYLRIYRSISGCN